MARGYVAGPMRGLPSLNFPAFDRAAKRGRDLGHFITSPADMDREAGIVSPDGNRQFTNDEVRRFVSEDLGILMSFRAEEGDFVALLPNWFKSVGATAEVFTARWLRLKFLDAETYEPWPLMPDGIPMPTARPPVYPTACSLGEGMCGESRDLAERSIIAIAEDFANRETL